MRIGHGYDVHAFSSVSTEPEHIILGGVSIPYERSLKAHSDGDVVLHALADAVLGAAALGDIGQHFPDTDEKWRGADSRDLLRHVKTLIDEYDYRMVNVDITIIAQAPKMMPHIPQMRHNIAQDLSLTLREVNVKATTTEQLGYIGRGEGIAVHAVVLLDQGN